GQLRPRLPARARGRARPHGRSGVRAGRWRRRRRRPGRRGRMSALFQATEPPRLDIGDVHAQWLTEYGESWARRNPKTAPELDAVYMQNFRQTRTALTERFLAGVPRDARVLEVGCAAGAQLDVLARLGF